MATIYVDNQPHRVKDGQNVLHACLSLGFNIPYFCWHPAMHSVGACRLCAVKQFKDENDRAGRIVMSCMLPAADGTRISIDDPDAVAFRRKVIEWLMVNHPHDCPVCDEGGECHLQDMTVMTGHAYRRHRFRKRTHVNQDLGPFVTHEMNRCIQCYRCVRFYNDLAGGKDLGVFGWHDRVYFGRFADGTLESPFAGNLVEVCPTGVFTDKTLTRHYTRKWDLQTAPSVCVHCGLGCNTFPGERYGSLRRIRNRFHREINGYFLCDRGRYGYEFVNAASRIAGVSPALSGRAGGTPATRESTGGTPVLPDTAVGVGSPRASLEANFALRKLVGPERFVAGVDDRQWRLVRAALEALRAGAAPAASVHDVAQADAALVLGLDVTNEAPRLHLALLQASRNEPLKLARELGVPEWNAYPIKELIQDRRGPVYVVTTAPTEADAFARRACRAAPADVARLGLAVARHLGADLPEPPGLPPEQAELARTIADDLARSERPVVLSGVGHGCIEIIQAAAAVAQALCARGKPARIHFAMPEPNTLGLAMMDARPFADAAELLRAADRLETCPTTLIVLENDLYRRAPSREVDALLAAAEQVIVLDHTASRTSERAHVLLPAATFAEGDGTFVSSEGRAQRFFRVYPSPPPVRESWRHLRDMLIAAGRLAPQAWANLDGLLADLAAELPALAGAAAAAPPADFRLANQKVPRQLHRYSGRTAMFANINVHEPQSPSDPDSPLAFSMEGTPLQPPAALVTEFWAPGWNSNQALNKFQQEVGENLRLGPAGVRLIGVAGVSVAAATIPPVEPRPVPEHGQDARDTHGLDARDTPDARDTRDAHATLLAVAAWQVFGSDELSMHSPAVAERAPKPAVTAHPEDASGLGLVEGQAVEVRVGHWQTVLPLRLEQALPRGILLLPTGLPTGLPGAGFVDLPGEATLAAAPAEAGGPT